MYSFVERHHEFIYTILPEFLHNKWIIVIFNIFLFALILKAANSFIEHFLNRISKYKDDSEFQKQLVTLQSIVKSIVGTIIIAFGTMYILNSIGIDIRPILTAAGVLGVAVGFGAKRFVEDIISGASLILEGQVKVGDYIDISGHEGTVEKIDIRLIRLRDLQGRVHYIRNGMVDTVVNYTRDFSYYVFELGVSYDTDMDYAIDTLVELGENFKKTSSVKKHILAPLEILGVDKFDDSAIIIKARFKTSPIKQWEVGRAFNKAIKKCFDEKGIEIPSPQRTLHIKNSNTLLSD